jgi:3-deoxy-manno-octulosonate cytidylyltransferase (CMP-KDO synthetase)
VVNIQGDNLGLFGAVLDRVIKSMQGDRSIDYATLATPIDGRKWQEKLYNPNVVKVVEDEQGNAAWFSRYPIPFVREAGNRRRVDVYPFLEHIGVYFFRKSALMEYASWRPGRAERAESLEQLRILENGKRIKLYKTRTPSISVDTEDALRKVKIS